MLSSFIHSSVPFICSFIHSTHSFIHSIVCFTTGPQPFPKQVLHRTWSSTLCFNFQHPLFSLRSSIGRWLLLPYLPVTYIIPSIFPSITCFRGQFLCKMWPLQLALCRIFLPSLTLCNTSSFHTHLVQLIFSILLQHHISKLPRYFQSIFQSVQVSSPYKDKLQMWRFSSFFLNLNLICCKVELLLSQILTHSLPAI